MGGILYEVLHSRILALRAQQDGLPSYKLVKRTMADGSKDVIIATLKQRIEKLQKENKELKDQLKIHFGKIYEQV